MERYYRNYKGIVIQNDDPKQMGRVKVYVPEVMTTLYKDWNSDKEKDKMITYFGDNLGGDITPELLTRLKKILPWAEVKQPIFGMSTPGTFDAAKNHFNIGNDTNSSVQQNKFNTAVTGSTTATGGGTTKNTYGSTSETDLTKTQDALQALCSDTNTTDINNYLNCNSAPQSVSTADSEETTAECGNASISSPIEDFAYVANIYDPTNIIGVTPSSSSTTPSTGSPSSTSTTGTTTPASQSQTTTTTTPSSTSSITKKDNIRSVSFSFLPTTNYKTSRSENKVLNQSTNEDNVGTFEQTIVSAFPASSNPSLTAVAAHAAPITYTLIRGTPSLSARQTFVPILFSPVTTTAKTTTKQTDQSIKVDAGQISFNGTNFSIKTGESSIDIPKTSLTKINVTYSNPVEVIDLSSERLGEIAQFFEEYSTPADSVFSQMIIPPASIPLASNNNSGSNNSNGSGSNNNSSGNSSGSSGNSGDSGSNNNSSDSSDSSTDSIEDLMDCTSTNSGTYNRGGGGSEIFSGISSDLLPVYNIHNSSIGGANPESKTSVSHGAKVPTQNDPNKVSGNNLKNSTIDPNPPIIPSSQNNKVKGMVSTPGVGAHVSVYFEQGNPLYPIVDGVFFTREDYQGVHDSARKTTATTTPQTSTNNNETGTTDESGSSSDTAPSSAASATSTDGSSGAETMGASVYGNKSTDSTTKSENNPNSWQYKGPTGLENVANQTVASNVIPLGSTIKVTDAETGNAINYNDTNPEGIYTVTDHGGEYVDTKIDFYVGDDKTAYTYFDEEVSGKKINVELISRGTGPIKKGSTQLFPQTTQSLYAD